MGRIMGIITGASAVEGLNLLAEHHWLFAVCASVIAFVSNDRRLRGHGVA